MTGLVCSGDEETEIMQKDICPAVNPSVVLREEFDDWAILFDPDSNVILGVNPVGVSVWKCLDGKRTVKDVLKEIKRDYDDMPDDAETHVRDFIADLLKRGLAR